MFNNLIESSSHKREFKRRGSFFLFTVAGYVLLFAAGGVASIFAYNAELDERTEEVITMLRPVDLPAPPRPIIEPAHISRPTAGDSIADVRRNPTLGTDRPEVIPDHVSTNRNPDLPVRPGIPYTIGNSDRNSGSPLGTGDKPSGPPSGTAYVPVTEAPPPPPAVVRKPVPQIVRKSVINGEALELPKPPYPILAKNNRIQGMVSVQVLIDETGKVISAHALGGNVFLVTEAERAAHRARFSPTKIGETPVKVSGIITYNFVLN